MEALTWIGPRREFTREVIAHDDLEPVLQRCRLQQRSDGVLYFLLWDVNLPSYKKVTPEALEAYQAGRAKNREQRWEGFLTDIPYPPKGLEQPLGYLETNTGVTHEWTEVTE